MSRASRSSEYRLIMAAIVGLCATAVVASVVPVVETITGVVLIVTGVAALGWWVVRRERRIRRRLADVEGTTWWPTSPAAAGARPDPLAGPGAQSPALPAPTRTSTSTSTADLSVHRAARAATRTGGAA